MVKSLWIDVGSFSGRYQDVLINSECDPEHYLQTGYGVVSVKIVGCCLISSYEIGSFIFFAARAEIPRRGQIKSIGQSSLPLRPRNIEPASFGGQMHISQMKSAAFICAAALVSSVLTYYLY